MPSVQQIGEGVVQADQEHLGRYYFYANSSPAPVGPADQEEVEDDEALLTEDFVVPELMFTDNDTNFERLYGGKNVTPFVKDAFHDQIIPGHRPPLPKPDGEVEVVEEEKKDVAGEGEGEEEYDSDATANGTSARPQTPPVDNRNFVNPEKKGTKVGAHYVFNNVPGNGGCAVVRLKLTTKTAEEDPSVVDEESFDSVIEERRMDSDEFYSRFNSGALSDDLRNIMRQGLSGMLWFVFLFLSSAVYFLCLSLNLLVGFQDKAVLHVYPERVDRRRSWSTTSTSREEVDSKYGLSFTASSF